MLTNKEIERRLSYTQRRYKYATNIRLKWELGASIEALNWVLGKQ